MAVAERVVISGAGCCTALGHDLDSVARSLREGHDLSLIHISEPTRH